MARRQNYCIERTHWEKTLTMPNPTKERSDVAIFINSIKNHYVQSVTGSLVAAIVTVFGYKGLNIPPAMAFLYGVFLMGGYAAFLAFRDQRRQNEAQRAAYESKISELNAELNEKKERENHKNLLGVALDQMESARNNVDNIYVKLPVKEFETKIFALKEDFYLRIIKSLEPLGSGEVNLIRLAKPKPIDRKALNCDPFLPVYAALVEKQELIADIEAKRDKVRERLERL